MWIVLFFRVTPFEDNVSTILSPIVDNKYMYTAGFREKLVQKLMDVSVHVSNALIMSFLQFH